MKILIIVALKRELKEKQIHPSCVIHYTGIGKINACIETLTAIYHYQPEFVINYGTAGALDPNTFGLLEIHSVLQHDYILDDSIPRGHDNDGKICLIENPLAQENHICATGDIFINQKDPWFEKNNVDVVDMELYAIASCCKKNNLPWRAFKFISDHADEHAKASFSNNVGKGETLFWEKLEEILK